MIELAPSGKLWEGATELKADGKEERRASERVGSASERVR